MMHRTFSYRHEKEARLIHAVPMGAPENPQVPSSLDGKNVVTSLPDDMRDLFRYFAEMPNVDQHALRLYFEKDRKEEELTAAEKDIKRSLDILSGVQASTPQELVTASRKMETFLADINSRNKIIKEQKGKLRDFEAKHETVPSPIRMTLETSKTVLGVVSDGLSKSTLEQKGIMLAGTVAAFFMARALWQRTGGGGFFKNVLLLGGGALLTAVSFEAFNKAVEQGTGRPLFSLQGAGKIPEKLKPGVPNTAAALAEAMEKTGKDAWNDLQGLPEAGRGLLSGNFDPLKNVASNLAAMPEGVTNAWNTVGDQARKALPGVVDAGKQVGAQFPVFSDTQSEWDARKHEMALRELEQTLDEVDIPEEFIAEIDAVNARMAPTIATVAPMQVEEFLAMYDAGRTTRSIDSIPRRRLPPDKLTPEERFAIIEDIAKTMRLADEKGDIVPLPKDRQGASMFFLMLDWKNAPEAKPKNKDA